MTNDAPPAAVAPTARTESPSRLRRHWHAGLLGLYRLATGKGGLANSYQAMFALAGPTVEREFDRFAQSPAGQSLLGQMPRSNLNRLLGDRKFLATMPRGSLADAYLDYLGEEGMGSPEDFLQAAGLREQAARFGWTDDQLWFIARMTNSHDIFHVMAGYDRSIVGEIGVNSFTAGQVPLLPLKLLFVYMLLLRPAHPFTWAGFVFRCYRHGRETPSLACVEYEALLALPLEEARRQIGIRPFHEVHPKGLPAAGRLLRRLDRNLSYPKESGIE